MPYGPPWYHGKIRGFGYRLTLPRQKILEVLSRSSKHLSAEEIYHALKGRLILNVGDVLPPNGNIQQVIKLGEWSRNKEA